MAFCIENFGRRLGFKNGYEMLFKLKQDLQAQLEARRARSRRMNWESSKMTVRQAKPPDCHEVNGLMGLLIDEIYAKRIRRGPPGPQGELHREALSGALRRGARPPLCRRGTTAGSWPSSSAGSSIYVFTIYWIYSLKEFRGKGFVRTSSLYARSASSGPKGCYKIEMYAYAEHNQFLDFCAKLGFRKGVLIEKIDVRLQDPERSTNTSDDADAAKRETKIKIVGEAGQGIKLLSFTLAQILAQLGNEVSLSLDYDASVRSGDISADLIYSDQPIENPDHR